ncbi:hypothetical protein [Amycolatopsis dendrobii]|uniref:Uncharacterized protein n=1 Tax=Amycolatopsis dendrobii TaxID=2760662 RepID=A0A7W3ZG73_9PSEU|nr:hypothetical protein [Amycolatopsis dendrobii]MBB1159837.1 hypothetical protein [Amycolatopsis dendrobii]
MHRLRVRENRGEFRTTKPSAQFISADLAPRSVAGLPENPVRGRTGFLVAAFDQILGSGEQQSGLGTVLPGPQR